ncbi:hypothetical protein ACFO5K_04880 [Nocardia halotolerans]|uniref:Low molecular weight antigen MTB12-like C-terminal domain-containing protein n=1 Tax=Nocardia halotolerans TaxID=1755878 RepID=A0ABV8VCK1_9NOCA
MSSTFSARAVAATACFTALFALTACGGSDEASVDAARSSANASLASSVAVSSSKASVPPPTAEELDAQIKRALDPNLPDVERTELIEDGAAFSDAIPDMYKALRDNPHAVYGVVDPVFDNRDGTLTATMRLDKDGSGTNIRTTIVHFVLIDGKWKISRTDLCGILRSADYHTAACG